MSLKVVAYQLSFWPDFPMDFSGLPDQASEDAERDRRNGRQWLKSAIAYCDFQAGGSWRRLSDPSQRNSSWRRWYLDGLRTLTDILSTPEDAGKIQVALPVLNPAPEPLPGESDLMALARRDLAAALVAESSVYTDYKLLSHLPRPKLARMLAQVRVDAAAAETRRRA